MQHHDHWTLSHPYHHLVSLDVGVLHDSPALLHNGLVVLSGHAHQDGGQHSGSIDRAFSVEGRGGGGGGGGGEKGRGREARGGRGRRKRKEEEDTAQCCSSACSYHIPEPPSQPALTSVVLVQLEDDTLDPLHILLCPLHLALHHGTGHITGVAGCKGGLHGETD